MLDNFSIDDLRTGVARIGGRTIVEASGGVALDTVAAIAETGVDVISVGALTHSARALDLGLDARVTLVSSRDQVLPGEDVALCLCGTDPDSLVVTVAWYRWRTDEEYCWRFVL